MLLAVILFVRRRISCSYAVAKKWIKSTDSSSCWPGCGISESHLPIDHTLSTLQYCHGLMCFGSVTFMSIGWAIGVSRCTCLRVAG